MKINGSERTPALAVAGPARHLAGMNLTLTLALLVPAVALMVFAGWRGSRPSQPHRGVRMVPWRFVMIMAAVVLVLPLLIHVAALLGVLPAPR